MIVRKDNCIVDFALKYTYTYTRHYENKIKKIKKRQTYCKSLMALCTSFCKFIKRLTSLLLGPSPVPVPALPPFKLTAECKLLTSVVNSPLLE